jgi:hypothetical protein
MVISLNRLRGLPLLRSVRLYTAALEENVFLKKEFSVNSTGAPVARIAGILLDQFIYLYVVKRFPTQDEIYDNFCI